jgi:hypothetical protein
MVENAQDIKFVRHLPDVTQDEYCGEFLPKKLDRAPIPISAGHKL